MKRKNMKNKLENTLSLIPLFFKCFITAYVESNQTSRRYRRLL